MQRAKTGELRAATLLLYAAGSLGTGLYSSVPGLLLLYFMTSVLAIEPVIAGACLFFPKFCDVLLDPLIGVASDHTRSRWGRRRPWLLAGAFAMPLAFALLFAVPSLGNVTLELGYVALLFFLSAVANSVFAIPYISMQAEATDHAPSRTRLVSFRLAFALAGNLLGAVAAPLLVEALGGGRFGYAGMGAALGSVCFVAMLLSVQASRFLPVTHASQVGFDLGRELRALSANRPFRVLASLYLLQLLGIGAFTAATPYFVVHVLGASGSTTGLLFLVLIAVAIVLMPAWSMVVNRIGQARAYQLAVLLYAAGILSVLAVPHGALPIASLVVAGAGLAGLQLLPFSMLADLIHRDTSQSGEGREGLYTGIWMALEKVGLALGPLITGALLSATGFVPGDAAVQGEAARTGIAFGFAVLPAVLVAASLLPVMVSRLRLRAGPASQ